MARAIANAEYPLHVWARTSHSLERINGTSAQPVNKLTDLAVHCDCIGLCLREDRDVDSVLVEGGLWAALRPGTILVNHGAGKPQFAEVLFKTRNRPWNFCTRCPRERW